MMRDEISRVFFPRLLVVSHAEIQGPTALYGVSAKHVVDYNARACYS